MAENISWQADYRARLDELIKDYGQPQRTLMECASLDGRTGREYPVFCTYVGRVLTRVSLAVSPINGDAERQAVFLRQTNRDPSADDAGYTRTRALYVEADNTWRYCDGFEGEPGLAFVVEEAGGREAVHEDLLVVFDKIDQVRSHMTVDV
jgi:hypothetical protein